MKAFAQPAPIATPRPGELLLARARKPPDPRRNEASEESASLSPQGEAVTQAAWPVQITKAAVTAGYGDLVALARMTSPANTEKRHPVPATEVSAATPASPVLDQELAEVTADGSISARRQAGLPTVLEPGSSVSGDAKPGAVTVTTPVAPIKLGAPAADSAPQGNPGHPDSTAQATSSASAVAPGATVATAPEPTQRTGTQFTPPPAEGGAPSSNPDGPGEPAARNGARVDAAAETGLAEAALAQIPAPNPDAVRRQALASPVPVEEGDPTAARQRIQELLASLRTEAKQQQAQIAEVAESRKQELLADADAQLATIDANEQTSLAGLRAGFGEARAALQGEADARRAELGQISQDESARAAAATAGHVAAAEAAFLQRRSALAQEAQAASQQPSAIAEREAGRADGELEAAARECDQAGEAGAARHSGPEEKQVEKRTAALRVGRESAADIRAKKAPIREDLTGRAESFSGRYFEYANTVDQRINAAREALVPAIQSRGDGVAASIQETEVGAMDALERRLVADLSALDAAEERAVERVQQAAAAAKAEVRSTASRATAMVDSVAVAGRTAVNNRASEVEAAVGGDPAAATVGGAAAIQEGIGAVAQVGIVTKAQLTTATSAGRGELAATVARFDATSGPLGESGLSAASRIQEQSTAALARLGSAHRAQAQAAIAAMEGDQDLMQSQVLAEVDGALAEARRELASINTRFQDEVRTATDEAIDKAIKPRTDQVETRVEEAIRQVDDSAIKGFFRAVGQILEGLVILVVVALVIAAFVAAFGFILTAWTAMMVAGALLLALSFIFALVQRSGQSAYRERTGAMIGRALLDTIGATGIEEAITGRDVATDDRLSSGQRTERGVLGGFSLIMLVVGVCSAIRGPPGGSFVRSSSSTPGIRGIVALFSEGGLWGGLKQLGGRMVEGAKSVLGEMVSGVKQTAERARGWVERFRSPKETRWKDEFWPEEMEKIPAAGRTIQVEASSIRTTSPELVTTPEYPEGAWKWSLFDEVSGAKFCEVFARTGGNSSIARGGPELWLHTKQALLPNGQRVQLKPNGFRWTPEALRHAMQVFRRLFGHAPENMSGDLAADNLGRFQRSYASLREAHPDWSPQQLGNEAVKETPFGRTRIEAGYGDLSVRMSEFGNASPSGGAAVANVPLGVRVEAFPSQGPVEGPRPLPGGLVPGTVHGDEED